MEVSSHCSKIEFVLQPFTAFTIVGNRNNTAVKTFEIKSDSDELLLHGYLWQATQPKAAVSLVHGFGEHCGRYEELASHLVTNDISVVGVDLRGHGKTPGPRGVAKNYDAIHGDVRTLIGETARRFPDVPNFLFGHSMGGGLVLHHGITATSDSLSGYLVSAPLILAKRPIPFALRAAVKALQHLVPTATMPIPVSGKNISNVPEEQDRYDNDPLNHNRLGFSLAVGMIEAGESILENASTWNLPLRLWHSRADRITSYSASEQFAKAATQCQFTTFEEVQHEMHQDDSRQEVFELMVEFIKRRSTASD
ncbi:alpha/beta hydrolase [Mariniblastus fucicola]|nr:alpha/beta hydrolase [Mariniblastus fucicola]